MDPILLTGANGYLGSAVAAALDATSLPWEPLRSRLEEIEPLSLPHRVVVHCAGALRHRAADWQRSNVDGTACLLAGLHESARVVLASSRSVYAPIGAGDALVESSPLGPRDGYGASKLQAEQLLRESRHAGVCCRLTTLFGDAPRGSCPSLPNVAARLVRDGQPVRLVARDVVVDYLAVADAARLLVQIAAREDIPPSVLNLSGQCRSLHGLIADVATSVSRPGAPSPSIIFDFPEMPDWTCLDHSQLQRLWPDFTFSDDRLAFPAPPHPSSAQAN